MKITIGGSMVFAKEQIQIKEILEKLGHEVLVTDDIWHYINDSSIKDNPEKEVQISREYDIMKTFFNKIRESDAFLVCNLDKKGIKGYLGTSVLMELGVAHDHDKKIYLLNDIDWNQSYATEIKIMNPAPVILEEKENEKLKDKLKKI